MAKRRRKRKQSPRLPWRKWALLIITALIGYTALSQDYRLGPESRRVFAAFARMDVSPAQFARMRGNMLPLTRKPPFAKWRRIAEVLDGDSVRLDDGTVVRLLGVDTPESSENRKLYTDLGKMGLADAKRDLLALGRAAARAARDRAQGQACWLEVEGNDRDQYDRTLAVVHLEDGVILNEWLLTEGYAKAHLAGTFQYRKRYISLQFLAQQQGAGFWGDGQRDGGGANP